MYSVLHGVLSQADRSGNGSRPCICWLKPRAIWPSSVSSFRDCSQPPYSSSEGLAATERRAVPPSRRATCRQSPTGCASRGQRTAWMGQRACQPSPVARTSRGGPTTPQTPSARRLAVSGPPPVPRSTEHRSRLLRVSGRSLVLQADRTRTETGRSSPRRTAGVSWPHSDEDGSDHRGGLHGDTG